MSETSYDERLPFRAIDVVEKQARRLGLQLRNGRPSLGSDAVIVTATDIKSWVAWRDRLEDEVTDIRRDGSGRIVERWAIGIFCDIPVRVQDASVYAASVIGGLD